jgi:hypothetical protein
MITERLISISVWTVTVAVHSMSGHYCHHEAKVSRTTGVPTRRLGIFRRLEGGSVEVLELTTYLRCSAMVLVYLSLIIIVTTGSC